MSLIFLLTIPHRFSLGFRSGEFAGQSITVKPWSLNIPLAVWAGAKFLLENEIYISIKLVSRRKHEVLWNFLVDGCVDCGLQKTQWTNTSRWHGSPNHHWLWKLHTGLQATWILCLSTLPPDSGTLISKLNAKFTFIRKVDFGPLSNSPVLFLLSPGKMLLTMFLFQKWLGSPFPEDVWAWWLLMHWLQASVHSLWSSPKCLNRLCLTVISSLRSSPLLVHIFLPNFFLPVNFAFNMLWYSTPWTATPFSNEPLWLTLFVEGVNDRLLDHCQVSSVPHYCGFKEQEIPTIFTVWMVIYWNSNVDILIIRDNDYWMNEWCTYIALYCV